MVIEAVDWVGRYNERIPVILACEGDKRKKI